jgi:hypothetical protein
MSHAVMSLGIIGITGMPVGLNNKFPIEGLIEAACYIIRYRHTMSWETQCNIPATTMHSRISHAGMSVGTSRTSRHACWPQEIRN